MDNAVRNRAWRMRRKPAGLVQQDDLELVTEAVRALAPGEVLLRLVHVSLDPGQQVYMQSTQELPGGTIWPGDVIRAWGVGEVVESRSDRFPVGSHARDHHGVAGVQEYAILPEAALILVDPEAAPLNAHLNILGMPGLTAHAGLSQIGCLQPGETVVVSGASGAVGAAAGQIARIRGCRVVGLAGGPEKCAHLTGELGFDAALDYRSGRLAADLTLACPDGIDVYFDNTGGEILDICLGQMARKGRIVFCGAIAAYGSGDSRGLTNYLRILTHQVRFEAFAYYDYEPHFASALAELAGWMQAGLLKHREDVAVGLENFVPVFHHLFTSGISGKLVLQVRDGVTR